MTAHPVHQPVIILATGDLIIDDAYKAREKEKTTFDPPLCWIPWSVDNSCGGQGFVNGDKWGPLSNHWTHTSYGKSQLFSVLTDEVKGPNDPATPGSGMMQAAVWRFRRWVGTKFAPRLSPRWLMI